MMLRILGHPELAGEGFFPAKAFLALAIVALSPGKRIQRKKVATLIWGDSNPQKTLSNLRYVLSKVRRWEELNNKNLLDISSKNLARIKSSTPSDVEILYNLDSSKPEEVLDLVINNFHGELLEGADFSEESGQEFLTYERHRILNHTILATLQAAKKTTGERVDRAFEALARVAPINEVILRAQITNMCLTGQRDAAKKLFSRFRMQLQQDLGCDVEIETRELASQMLPSIVAPMRAALSISTQAELAPKSKDKTLPKLLLLPPAADPFSSSNPAIEALAKGLFTEVNLLLGRMRAFAIFAPFSANQLTQFSTQDAAQHVEADYVVHSTLFSHVRGKKHPQFGIAISRVKTCETLLSEVVEMDLRNLSNLHFEIASSISNAVIANINSNEIPQFESSGIKSAYLHYIFGQQSHGYDLKSLRVAKKHFKNAIRRTPTFSSAHAMLARTLTNEWLILQRAEADLLSQSMRSAKRAIELDPLNPLGYRELGHVKLYSGSLNEATSYMKTALEYAPNVADILVDQADIFIHKGDGEKAARILDKATALNPMPPDSYIWTKATAQFLKEDYEVALGTFKLMKNTDPVERLMAACAAQLGEHKMASFYRKKWLQNYPDSLAGDWPNTMPMAKPEIAQRVIDALRCAGFD